MFIVMILLWLWQAADVQLVCAARAQMQSNWHGGLPSMQFGVGAYPQCSALAATSLR